MWITLLETGDNPVESYGKPGKNGLMFGLQNCLTRLTISVFPLFHHPKS